MGRREDTGSVSLQAKRRFWQECRERVNWSALDREIKTDADAVKLCQTLIREYEAYWRCRKPLFKLLGGSAIVLAATTPVLATMGLPDWAIALPAAVAAALGGVVGVTQWQEGIARTGYTAEVPRCELMKFQARAAPYREGDPVKQFVSKMADVRTAEAEGWRGAFARLTHSTGQA